MAEIELWFRLAANGKISDLHEVFNCSRNPHLVNSRNENGETALHISANMGHPASLRWLITMGANPNLTDYKGNTPLHSACLKGSLPCIVLLTLSGADMDRPNDAGESPLDLIDASKRSDLAGLLRVAKKEMSKGEPTEENPENIPTADLLNEGILSNGNLPIPVISNEDVRVVKENDLAAGPNLLYCLGSFCEMDAMIKCKTQQSTSGRREIAKEALILRDIRHQNILLLIGVCLGIEQHYLVFEFPTMGFLHRLVFVKRVEFKSDDLLRIARDVSCALAFLHKFGLVHGSTSTHSIVLFNNCTAKICNFEHAQPVSDRQPISHLACLYPYMSPEQISGHPATPANDVYGLGVAMFETVTGVQMRELTDVSDCERMRKDRKHALKLIPKSHESSVGVLIKSCLDKAKKRPSSTQVYEWLQAQLECRVAPLSPASMRPEDDIPLFPSAKIPTSDV